jgi:hypothetical protein
MKMKLDKSKLPAITSALFAFLLTILFTILFFIIVGYIGLHNGRCITDAMNHSNYYERLYLAITKDAEAAAMEAGLPKSVLKDVITLERVYINGNNYIRETLNGEKAMIPTDNLSEGLSININQYITSQGFALTEDIKTKCSAFIDDIKQRYQDGIQLKLIKELYNLRLGYQKFMMFIIPVLILLIGFICFLLNKIHPHNYRGVRYITCSLIASSLLMVITGIALYGLSPFNGLELSPGYYRGFIEAGLQWMFKVFLFLGWFGLTMSMALILVTSYIKNGALEH